MVRMETTRALRAVLLGAMGLIVGAGTVPLTGCSNFFVCQKASCTSSSGTTGTGDYVYVSNSSSGSNYINAYQIGTGTLTAISGQPYNLSYIPLAMAVSPNDDFLYVMGAAGSSTVAGIYVYPLSTSTGEISSNTSDVPGTFGAMAISPDGNYLFTLDAATGDTLTEYSVNTSTGALTFANSFTTSTKSAGCGINVPAGTTCAIAVSPSENFVAVSMGTSGTVIYPYSSSTTQGGITSQNSSFTITPATSVGDFSAAFDDSGYLYVASTPALTPYAISSSTITTEAAFTYSTSVAPRSVTLSPNYSYIYTADSSTSQISAFSVTTGKLAQLSGSPVTGPTDVTALAAERSGTYILAAGYSTTNGLQLLPISSTGLSASVASEPTGTDTTVPVVMAVTH